MRLISLVFLFVFFLAGCQQQSVTQEVPEVLASFPHDPIAFTQGLLLHNGKLYESTGLYNQSDLREVDIEAGQVIRILPLEDQYFAEGLARVEDKLIQITWREGKAFVYDLETFNLENTFNYSTEGWGLCYDGESLFMTDGTSTLYQRDPNDFSIIKEQTVQLKDETVIYLNELECVGEFVYANIWQSDRIVKINKTTGRVVAEIDASNLLSANEKAALSRDAVLNGIAYNPEKDTFYLTGKLWPKLFEVRFVESN